MILAEHVLHAVARASLRVCPPLTAKRVVDVVAGALPALTTVEAARGAWARLDGRGTCLSRAITVAARFDDAEVVIGASSGATSFAAHAWVDVGGRTIGATAGPPEYQEIARLRRRALHSRASRIV